MNKKMMKMVDVCFAPRPCHGCKDLLLQKFGGCECKKYNIFLEVIKEDDKTLPIKCIQCMVSEIPGILEDAKNIHSDLVNKKKMAIQEYASVFQDSKTKKQIPSLQKKLKGSNSEMNKLKEKVTSLFSNKSRKIDL